MIRKRIEWIDYAKALAIYLIVLLHVHCNYMLDKYINAFIMPGFFIMSGFLFSYRKNPSFVTFVLKRCRQLVVPYVWIGLISYLLWFFFMRYYGDDAANPADPIEQLDAMLMVKPGMIVYNVPLWSFIGFYVVEIVYYILRKLLKRDWLIAVLSLCGAYGLSVSGVDCLSVPLALAPSVCGITFYSLGRILRHCDGFERLLNGNIRMRSLSFAGLLVMFVLTTEFNGRIKFYICQYDNFILFVLSSLSGAFALIMLSSLISSKFKDVRAVKFISVGTLIICGFHFIAFSVVKGFMYFVYGVNTYELSETIWRGLAFATVSFGLTLPVVYIIRKYFRFLVDK